MKNKKQHDANRLKSNDYDPKMALTVANSFFNAAERCNEQPYTEKWLPVPAIVNYTFSCEVYIKALLMKTGTKKGHNLLTLFNQLPYNIQIEIQQSVDCSNSYFREMLENISDSFEEVRYAYEYQSLNVNLKFIQKLSASLKNISHKIIINEFINQTSP